ncbi:MAG: hypothetical protein WCG26_16375 [Chloroflexales bacterium]
MHISDPNKPNYNYLTRYVCGIELDFGVLEFKDHGIYPDVLREIGFTDVAFAEQYDHVLYHRRLRSSGGRGGRYEWFVAVNLTCRVSMVGGYFG